MASPLSLLIKSKIDMSSGMIADLNRQLNELATKLKPMRVKIEIDTGTIQNISNQINRATQGISRTTVNTQVNTQGLSNYEKALTRIIHAYKMKEISDDKFLAMSNRIMNMTSFQNLSWRQQEQLVNLAVQANERYQRSRNEEIKSNQAIQQSQERLNASRQKELEYIQKMENQLARLKAGRGNIFENANVANNLNQFNTALNNLRNGTGTIQQVNTHFDTLRTSVAQTSAEFRNVNRDGYNFSEMLEVGIKKFIVWGAATTVVMQALHKMKEAFTFIEEMNKLFVNLQMEMTKTNLDFGEVTRTANEYAKSMNTTTESVMKAISVFGTYNSTMDEVLQKSKAAIVLGNITGQSIEQTSDALMGTMSQYNLQAEDAMHVVDIIAGTSRNLSVDYSKVVNEISEGLRTVGSVARESKASIEETSALIGTLVEKTRTSGSQSANAVKTIFSRMARVGEESDPEAFQKIEKAMYDIGISMKSVDGSMKPVMQTLGELASKWDTLTDSEKSNIAEQSAGVYRRNYFLNIMSSWKDIAKNTEAAIDSEGVAMQKQEIYANSLAASMNNLKAQWEAFYLNTVNSDLWKSAINGTAQFMSILNNLSNFFGNGLTVAIGVATTALVTFNKNMGLIRFNGFNAQGSLFSGTLLDGINKRMQALTMSMENARRANVRLQQSAEINSLFNGGVIQPINQTSTSLATFTLKAIGSAVATGAVTIAVTALNAAITMGISLLVTSAITAIYEWANSFETVEDKINKVNKAINEIDTNLEKVANLKKEYVDLASKTKLTVEEHDQLVDVQNKLANLAPELIDYYDSQGNAILKTGDAVDEFTNKLKLQRVEEEKKKQDLYFDEYIEGYTKLINFQDMIQENEKTKTTIPLMPASNETKELSLKKVNDEIVEYQKNIGETSEELSKYTTNILGTIDGYEELGKQSKIIAQQFGQEQLFFNFKNSKDTSEAIDKTKDSFASMIQLLKSYNFEQHRKDYEEVANSYNQGKITLDQFRDSYEKFKASLPSGISENLVNTLVPDPSKLVEVAKGFGDLAKAVETANEAYEQGQKDIDGYQSGVKDLASIYTTLNEKEKVSADTILDLIQKYPEYALQITKLNGSKDAAISLTETLFEIEKQRSIAKIEQDKVELQSTLDKLKAMEIAYKALSSVMPVVPTSIQQGFNDFEATMSKINALDNAIDYIKGTKLPDFATEPTNKKKKEPNDKVPDTLKLEIDLYTKLNAEVDRATNALEKLKAQEDLVTGKEKIALLEKEIVAYKNLDKAKENVLKQQKDERADLRKRMEKQNFKFEGDKDSINLATNYSTKIKQMYDAYNKMAYGTEKADQARATASNKIKDMEKFYARILELNKDTFATEKDRAEISKSINGIKADEIKIQQEMQKKMQDDLKKNAEDKIKIYEDAQQQIVDLLKKQKDKEKDLLEESQKDYKEYIDNKIKDLDRLKAEQDFSKDVDEISKKIIEKQTDINKYQLAALSGDKSAIAKINELNKDKAELEKDLAEKQTDRTYELTKQSYQDQSDAYDKYIDNKKDEIDKFVDEANLKIEAEKMLTNGMLEEITKSVTDLFTTTGENATKAGEIVQNTLLSKLQAIKNIHAELEKLKNTASNNGVRDDDMVSVFGKSGTTPHLESVASVEARQKARFNKATDVIMKNKIREETEIATGRPAPFAREGYTGTWSGGHGRLAEVHPDEFILNKSTVGNMLQGNLQNILPRIGINMPRYEPIANGDNISVNFGSLLNVGNLSNIDTSKLKGMAREAANEAVNIIRTSLGGRGQFRK